MFSFDGIVLKKNHIKDNKSLILIFSKEYGKISAWVTESKKKTSVDIGNVYNFSSKTDNSINKIDGIKTKVILKTDSLGFSEINNILQIITYLEKILPSGVVTESVYNDYIEIIKYLVDKESNYKIYVFFILRLIKRIGIANPPKTGLQKDNLVKIFSVINIYEIEKLMRIGGIEKDDLDDINSYNTNTLINYIN